MALKIVWTKRAIAGFYSIITFLEEQWAEKEVRNFVQQTEELSWSWPSFRVLMF